MNQRMSLPYRSVTGEALGIDDSHVLLQQQQQQQQQLQGNQSRGVDIRTGASGISSSTSSSSSSLALALPLLQEYQRLIALNAASSKKRSWKKPVDKPKRPLSAYNLFFQLERERLVKDGLPDDDEYDTIPKYTADDVQRVCDISSRKVPEDGTDAEKAAAAAAAAAAKRKHRKTHGMISFADLARTIAKRWKLLSDDDRVVFDDRAALEKERYRSELAEWNAKQKQQQQSDLHNKRNKIVSKILSPTKKESGLSSNNTKNNDNDIVENENDISNDELTMGDSNFPPAIMKEPLPESPSLTRPLIITPPSEGPSVLLGSRLSMPTNTSISGGFNSNQVEDDEEDDTTFASQIPRHHTTMSQQHRRSLPPSTSMLHSQFQNLSREEMMMMLMNNSMGMTNSFTNPRIMNSMNSNNPMMLQTGNYGGMNERMMMMMMGGGAGGSLYGMNMMGDDMLGQRDGTNPLMYNEHGGVDDDDDDASEDMMVSTAGNALQMVDQSFSMAQRTLPAQYGGSVSGAAFPSQSRQQQQLRLQQQQQRQKLLQMRMLRQRQQQRQQQQPSTMKPLRRASTGQVSPIPASMRQQMMLLSQQQRQQRRMHNQMTSDEGSHVSTNSPGTDCNASSISLGNVSTGNESEMDDGMTMYTMGSNGQHQQQLQQYRRMQQQASLSPKYRLMTDQQQHDDHAMAMSMQQQQQDDDMDVNGNYGYYNDHNDGSIMNDSHHRRLATSNSNLSDDLLEEENDARVQV